ncbi:hypothetical protein EVAR_84603_1 [Eumeta japonica]|uniref:Uncharacterized protein n=1 Tax=Eumeta variegata TaxID=151549 RepID=A0A4C1UYC4_EUMVA|nr:hypothetical protein EVAR_84603_1 [Eumeta japonica]
MELKMTSCRELRPPAQRDCELGYGFKLMLLVLVTRRRAARSRLTYLMRECERRTYKRLKRLGLKPSTLARCGSGPLPTVVTNEMTTSWTNVSTCSRKSKEDLQASALAQFGSGDVNGLLPMR